ncbi:MAG: PaaI family thioesterase [Pseudomonadota bacterium]
MTNSPFHSTPQDTLPALDLEAMNAFLEIEFPQAIGPDKPYSIVRVGYGDAKLVLSATENDLRPGGTLSGPSLMTAADLAAYVCVLSMIGKVALAVTTNLNINFLRKPPLSDLACEARPLKVGKSLIVVETALYSNDDPDKSLVAHATLTYSVPPQK